MRHADIAVLGQALTRLREVNEMLDDVDAGVCLTHLEACIAALKSRLAKMTGADGNWTAGQASPRKGSSAESGR